LLSIKIDDREFRRFVEELNEKLEVSNSEQFLTEWMEMKSALKEDGLNRE
jgi:hypothetical protein